MLPDINFGPRVSMLCRGGRVLTMLRMIGGIATAITSIYVAVARDGHNLGDVAYTSLWCFALIGGAVLFMVWRHMSKMPNAYSFLSIVFFYATQATLLEGPGLVLDGILPVLPLVVVSGSFLASLFLSFYKNMSSTQADVEQSAWDVAASCLV
ncbi:hypothetical protein CABS01_06682 [Colletotrichum abscissum]|nr:uncharacterized protein CABS01_06682 [Colletotrichum abscissum]KAK1514703.1 hypothetical protein CABS01_06682 [Colletotrichum abscissum]